MKKITDTLLDTITAQANASPRRRANHNLHEQLEDSVQRLAIAMEPDTFVRPHRHRHTWELLTPLRGRYVVLFFDEEGVVTAREVLGGESRVIEFPANTWHAVLSLDKGGVIFEVKRGPYEPLSDKDFAPWVSEFADAAAVNAWYAQAQVGDSLAK